MIYRERLHVAGKVRLISWDTTKCLRCKTHLPQRRRSPFLSAVVADVHWGSAGVLELALCRRCESELILWAGLQPKHGRPQKAESEPEPTSNEEGWEQVQAKRS